MPASRRVHRRLMSPVIMYVVYGFITLLFITISVLLFTQGEPLGAAAMLSLTTVMVWVCWILAARPRVVLTTDALFAVGPITTRVVPYRQLEHATSASAVVFETHGRETFTTSAFGGAPIHAFMRDRRGERLAADLAERIATAGEPVRAPLPRPRLDLVPVLIGAVLITAMVATWLLAAR